MTRASGVVRAPHLRYRRAVAVPVQLEEAVMRLPEHERRELAAMLEELEAQAGVPEPEGAEREALLAALARSEADERAGRVRSGDELIAKLRAMLP